MKKKTDPYTGETFIPKRSNQKFAVPENRIKYNNEKAKQLREEKSEIDKIIDKNLKIFKTYLAESNLFIKSKDFFEGAGLNLNIFTHQRIEDGQLYLMTHKYGYTELNNGDILIKKFDA